MVKYSLITILTYVLFFVLQDPDIYDVALSASSVPSQLYYACAYSAALGRTRGAAVAQLLTPFCVTLWSREKTSAIQFYSDNRINSADANELV